MQKSMKYEFLFLCGSAVSVHEGSVWFYVQEWPFAAGYPLASPALSSCHCLRKKKQNTNTNSNVFVAWVSATPGIQIVLPHGYATHAQIQ